MRSPTERTNAKFALTVSGAAKARLWSPARAPARPTGERAREGRFGEIGGFAAERATWAKSRDGTRTPSLGPFVRIRVRGEGRQPSFVQGRLAARTVN